MGLKRRSRITAKLPEVSINITSLMDVLTVLLFFLVKSFSVTSASVDLPKDVRLPASVSDDQFEEGVTVALSKEALYFHNKPIIKLSNGHFKSDDLAGDRKTLIALKDILDRENAKRKSVFQGAGDLSFLPPGKIVIQSDKKLPFGVVKHLLHTATVAGYTDYQFVIQKEEN